MFSALVMASYGAEFQLTYWKPLQTGAKQDSDLLKLKSLTNLEDRYFQESLYHFEYPASPHYSASLEGEKVEPNLLIRKFKEVLNKNFIIEGVGGLSVPINGSMLLIDFLAGLKIPVILVVSSLLGTINHSLLSLEALKTRNIPIIGFFVYGKNNDLLVDNIFTIQSFSGVNCLGYIDIPDNVVTTNDFLEFTKEKFDLDGRIKNLFQKQKL